MAIEVWTTGIAHVHVAPRAAARAEADGWDGMVVVDSQNLAGDPFVGLVLAARETSALRLGTGVTNPATRHPAATAAAIASVHVASGGRAVLGVGRGDSALAHIGLAPAQLADLERFVRLTRAYLRGEAVPLAAARDGGRPLDMVDESRLHWLPADLEPVPVEVAATGPKAIAMAAANADRVLLAVGADPERVAWAAGVARDAGAAPVGAFVNVVAHPDVAIARSLAAGGLSTFARFSVMDGAVRAPIDEPSARVLHDVHDAYDLRRHTRGASPQASRLTDDFIDRFGVVGPPDHCAARLRELVDLGVDRLVVVGPSVDADRDQARVAHRAFVTDVLPALREVSTDARP
jgi:5,10-methylenetetrahydromethanopterin reductase